VISLPEYDVVIAGAGPAGCAAAIVLQQAGVKVCLADKVPEGTFRVGESLPGAATRLLKRLGIPGIENLVQKQDFQRCVANVSSWGNEQWSYQDGLSNPDGGGWHLDRFRFDEALRQKAFTAGVPFYEARIGEVKRTAEHGFMVRLNGSVDWIRSQWLMDATGRRAALSRKLNIQRKRISEQVAAVCWMKASPGDADQATRIRSARDGWWYSALLPGQCRVAAFFGLPSMVPGMINRPEIFFKELNAAAILPYHVDESVLIKIKAADAGTARSQEVIVNGLAAVGDAALSLDPLSSQGIFFALYSGIRAAEAIVTSLALPLQLEAALAGYRLLVNNVFESNQKARKYFYSSECRFLGEEFWQRAV
jgi:flavin-dependent dehydrogenase